MWYYKAKFEFFIDFKNRIWGTSASHKPHKKNKKIKIKNKNHEKGHQIVLFVYVGSI